MSSDPLRWKSRVRYFLAWSSSFGPLLAFYRWAYRAIIAFAVALFRRCDGIRALYLVRGCSKKEITPGVSDIDFIVIVNDDARQRRRAESVFSLLQTLTASLIPYHPAWVRTEEALDYMWRNMPLWRYRLQEGKSNWSLLLGRDVLASLPAINDMDRRTACFGEMNYWWVQFCDFILQNDKYRHDNLIRNSICYKAVAEVLNARHALISGEFCYSKEDALRREDSPLTRKLLATRADRRLESDKALEQQCYRFLIAAFSEVWDRFRDDPFLQVYPEVGQEVDTSGAEIEKEKSGKPFQEIAGFLAAKWGPVCRGIHLLRSAFWQVEDLLLFVEVDPAALPTLEQLEELINVAKEAYSAYSIPVILFLRLPHLAFPLTPSAPRDFNRGVLTPATTPDVFLQLGEQDVYWSTYSNWYLVDWERNWQWLDASPQKRTQLNIIAQGAAAGHVRYPLSLSSISGRA